MALEILKYILPALIVFATTYYIIRSFMKNEERKRKYEWLIESHKTILPVRLQAYERATLFLERISPDSLLKRHHKKGMTCGELHSILLTAIRTEFEHNFSQQIYISHTAWQMVVKAKENTIQIINTNASRINPEESSILLSKAILEDVMDMAKTPSLTAIEFLKQEVKETFF